MDEGQRPLSVGFFFSLGHSTIVFALGLLVVGRRARAQRRGAGRRLDAAPGDRARRPARLGVVPAPDRRSQPGLLRQHRCGVFRRCAAAPSTRPSSRRSSTTRGFMNALLRARHARRRASRGRCTRWAACSASGFDTATEVALLVLAGAGAAGGLPFYAILCLPILFAAGHVAVRHDRRRVHELRLRLGLLASRSARSSTTSPSPGCRSRSRCCVGDDRAALGARRQAQPHAAAPGTSSPTSTSTSSAT